MIADLLMDDEEDHNIFLGFRASLRSFSGKSAGLGTNLAEKYSHSTEMYRILFLEHR
jgi:hypothetical protein